MNTHSSRKPTPSPRYPALAHSCSVWVLASLGVLGVSSLALAQGAGGVLPSGTLPVLRSVVSGRVAVNAPAPGAARSLMTIDQKDNRAIIDWRSFNIANGSEVLFNHPGSTASTLNRIYDANPSIIQGKLSSAGPVDSSDPKNPKATPGGQLLLINQNGILFDRGSQVNTGALIAATLNISNEKYLSGVYTSNTEAAFEGGYDSAGNTLARRPDGSRPGNIGIGSFGPATAAPPQIEVAAGGSIMLFAPRIDNDAGLIKAPDGQVILAAGRKVYLALNPNEADITLRGLVVEVEADAEGAGLNLSNLIRNAGEITADRGNVSLAALAVNQEGRITAKSAVQSNGSIYLKAHTKDPALSGSVTFKAGSVTEVAPDAADKTTITDSQDYTPFRGVVEVAGKTITSSGSITAPGGRIVLAASDGTDSADPTQVSQARVYLDAGSVTSVAGAWSEVDFAKNLSTFRVTSNELKNSPDQKTGILRGATVTVDLRRDNNILALDGYRNAVPRTVAEKAAAGGEIVLRSSGDLIQRAGATLDLSGGGYRYTSGFANTTRLLGEDGKTYGIDTAPQALRYAAQLDRYEARDERWGQVTSIANPLGSVGTFQDRYAEGKAGGTLTVGSAGGVVLEGVLKGGVTIGSDQTTRAPNGATLVVGSGRVGTDFNPRQRIGNITWRQQANDSLGAVFTATSELTPNQRDNITLASTQVFGDAALSADGRVETGFGTVTLNSNGRISVPEGVSIKTDVGAALNFAALVTDIGGSIRAPAGSVLITPASGTEQLVSPEAAALTGNVLVRTGAHIATAGAWLNNSNRDGSAVGEALPTGRQSAAGGSTTLATDGGSITVRLDAPEYQTTFARGATLDVGGGAAINSSQRVAAGKGGKLSVANGTANQTTSDWLQADLLGFAIGTGAELTLNLNRAVIEPTGANGVLRADTTRLESGLFSDHGFSKVTVNAFNAIDITANTAVKVQQQNLVVDPTTAAALPTGGDLAAVTTRQALPAHQRGVASVAFNANRFTLNEGAAIQTDARGQVTLSAADSLAVQGRISAPGGTVALTLKGADTLTATDLQLGNKAVIDVAGTFVASPNDRGLTQGSLYNGGSVTLAATQAGVRVDAGARIDVGAPNQVVHVASTGAVASPQSQTLVGHAGTLTVKSQGATQLLGNLQGRGGDASAAGGSFVLETTRPDNQAALPSERRIVVTPTGTALAPAPSDVADAVLNLGKLAAGGFEKLRLQSENRIEFQGSSQLDFERGIRLDAPLIEVAGAANVRLKSATVSMGQSLGPRTLQSNAAGASVWLLAPSDVSPVLATQPGQGTFSVQAGAVDIFGSVTVNGSQLTRIESASDVRFIGRSVLADAVNAQGTRDFRQAGWLHTAGNLEFKASQLYPATRSEFTVAVADTTTNAAVAGTYLLVSNNGHAAGDVYSAAGALSLQAQNIVQNGIVKAPQGQIELRAAGLLELGSGSTTSVAGNGLNVLYGTTESGVAWRYADGANSFNDLSKVASSGKLVELRAPEVAVRAGATVDLRGGGDVLAVEFVPGNGGDADITQRDNTYAIMPKSRLASVPYDSHLQLATGSKDIGSGFSVANGRDAALYDAIDIAAGSAVPAGEYVLLPARFALLADAYLVQLQTGAAYRNLTAGQTTALSNGDVVAAGHRSAAGTSVRESQSVGVVVLPGSAVRKSSDYTLSGATLFAQAAERGRVTAPAAPWDAGRMVVADATRLTLNGQFDTAAGVSPSATPARTASVDIDAARIAVVDTVGSAAAPAGFLQISGNSLSQLNASVLLGGRRSDSDTGITITTAAEEIVVANTPAGAVNLPELTLSARNSIDIRTNASLRATGSSAGSAPGVITAESTGALLRLSNSGQVRVDRGTAGADLGDIRIAAGASLAADKALLLDATRSTESSGLLRVGQTGGSGGSLSLASGQVSLGETQAATGPLGGLVLSNTALQAYGALDEFVLRGYQSIDLLGNSQLGTNQLTRLTLDTPLLRGVRVGAAAASATVTAAALLLTNSAPTVAQATGGSGRLNLRADTLRMGAGDKAIAGFSAVSLQADGALLTQGTGALRVASALNIETPVMQAGTASKHSFSAVDDSDPAAPVYAPVSMARGGASAGAGAAAGAVTSSALANPGVGGQLSLQGQRVQVATTVQARSGQLSLAATGGTGGTGAGDITLASGAVLDAAGQSKDFNGTYVAANGGAVNLSAAGAVAVQAGAQVDVSAAARGGDAGRLQLRADSLALGGNLSARAGAGARSGTADLDLNTLADFSALNNTLNAGGFAAERALRLRRGDLNVAATDVVSARRVTLSADNGGIGVAGTLGNGAAEGGVQVNLHAGNGLTLAAGSQVLAQGSAAGARGGEVRASTRSGTLVFDPNALIDVRAGTGGAAGAVVFGVARDDAGATAPAQLAGLVKRGGATGDSKASVDVEATRVYGPAQVGSSINSTFIAGLANEHAAFVAGSNAAATALTGNLRDESGVLSGARLLGAVELQAAADLSIDATWDLTSRQWLAGNRPGTLSIRTPGNLTLTDTLGAPRLATNSSNVATNVSNQSVNHALQRGDTWNIRLTAGADTAAADTLKTLPPQSTGTTGDLLLAGANANIRTGTGRIDLAAARDVRMDNVASAIYTAGRAGAADTAVNGNQRWAVDGGDISIRAGGSVVGPADGKDLWVTDWLRRPRVTPVAFNQSNSATDWWSYRPRFQQAVGALAGGAIDIHAGGDITDLSAMSPTAGRTYLDTAGKRQVEVTGGGDLRVQAGGHVSGGAFLVGRGVGQVEAAGNVGSGKPVQVYVMGVGNEGGAQGARIDLVAGGSAALQSADNPTMMTMISSNRAVGPSFHPTIPTNINNNVATSFFTYTADTGVGVFAKGGDVSYGGKLANAENWRTFGTSFNNSNIPASTAFPANLALVAMNGNVSGPEGNLVTTFPSAQASLVALAGKSINNLGLSVSDLSNTDLVTPFNRFTQARPTNETTEFFSTGARVSSSGKSTAATRIVKRENLLPYGTVGRDAERSAFLFDVQALDGSIAATGSGESQLFLPGVSRVRASEDIVSARLTLQNLQESDVSVVRAETGDVRNTTGGGIEVRGPGRLLLQAGRNIDLGRFALQATGNDFNPQLPTDTSARLSVVAGVTGNVDLARMGSSSKQADGTTITSGAYGELIALNNAAPDILALYALLETEADPALVLAAGNIAALAQRSPSYARFVALDSKAPRALAAYQGALRLNQLPLGPTGDATAAAALYKLLNADPNVAQMQASATLADLAAAPGGAAYQPYVDLGTRYPQVYTNYVQRRSKGAQPTALTPVVFSESLANVTADVLPTTGSFNGSILTYQTSIQTFGGSDIDLWAPGGDIVVGLTTPGQTTIGVLTNAGGAVRSVLSGDFNINQGKVITAQGGDILLFSGKGSIDAGRGSKTSQTTAAPSRKAIFGTDEEGQPIIIDYETTLSSSATGSGIQTLTSDPDGLGPRPTPKAGDVYLFAPAGTIDAGEAGIRSSGNILINAQTVLNAGDIRAGGSSQGVPQVQSGSLATSLASGGNTANTAKNAEDTAKAAAEAGRKAAVAPATKPTILTVEVMGFGDKNCKEDDKDCFAK